MFPLMQKETYYTTYPGFMFQLKADDDDVLAAFLKKGQTELSEIILILRFVC